MLDKLDTNASDYDADQLDPYEVTKIEWLASIDARLKSINRVLNLIGLVMIVYIIIQALF
jgi:hypothetical protein